MMLLDGCIFAVLAGVGTLSLSSMRLRCWGSEEPPSFFCSQRHVSSFTDPVS